MKSLPYTIVKSSPASKIATHFCPKGTIAKKPEDDPPLMFMSPNDNVLINAVEDISKKFYLPSPQSADVHATKLRF